MRNVRVRSHKDPKMFLDFEKFAIIRDIGVVVDDGDHECLYPWHRVDQIIVPKGEISGGQL